MKSLLYRRVRLWFQLFSQRHAGYLYPLLSAMVAVILVVAPLSNTSLAAQVDEVALRLCYWLRGSEKAPQSAVIITLDANSKRKLGIPIQRMWPRDVVAQLITKVNEGNPKNIFVDIVFGSDAINLAEDPPLIEALRVSRAIIGSARDAVKQPQASNDHIDTVDPLPRFAEVAGQVIPLTIWTGRAGGVATYISAVRGADRDRIPLLRLFESIHPIWLDPPEVNDMISFYGPPGTIDHISAYELLTDFSTFKDRITGRVAFIGLMETLESEGRESTIRNLVDVLNVPVSRKPMAGVEIHATIFSNLFGNTWLDSKGSDMTNLKILLASSTGVIAVALALQGFARPIFVLVVATTWCLIATWGMKRHILIPGGFIYLCGIPTVTALLSVIDGLWRKIRRPKGGISQSR